MRCPIFKYRLQCMQHDGHVGEHSFRGNEIRVKYPKLFKEEIKMENITQIALAVTPEGSPIILVMADGAIYIKRGDSKFKKVDTEVSK